MAYTSPKRYTQRIIYFFSTIGMWVLLLMMLLTTVDVIGRNLFRQPVRGTQEISQYMLVVIVLLGIGYTQQLGGHVRIPLFVSRLSPKVQRVIDSIVTILILVLFAAIIWQSGAAALESLRTGRVSSILPIPMYPFKFLISVGVFLMCVELLLKLITDLKGTAMTGGAYEAKL